MARSVKAAPSPLADAAMAGLLFAVDPAGTGGIALRSMPGPVRDSWLSSVRALFSPESPWRKVPVNIGTDALLGGLDFSASLAAGRPVFASGLLAAAHEGVLLLAMAERQAPATTAAIARVADQRELCIERDGISARHACRFGVIALDEGLDHDEALCAPLADRMAFMIDLNTAPDDALEFGGHTTAHVAAARQRLAGVALGDSVIDVLCAAAAACAIESARATLLAVRVARAAAALAGKATAGPDEASLAARLVLAPRARAIPQSHDAEQPQPPQTPPDNNESGDDGGEHAQPSPSASAAPPEDVVVAATAAAIPADLLERLQQGMLSVNRLAHGGRGAAAGRNRRRGRPTGTRHCDQIRGERVHLLATLKAAAPWQSLRRNDANASRKLHIRRDDLHVTRFEEKIETTTIFVVDASGSQAAQRFAEVKGAIELLLADCYVRRDQVAMIVFRGTDADVVLPPTRALARAKRTLAAVPGGGGTPLAAGIDAARELAQATSRLGRIPAVVFLTDGRANVARQGETGSERGGTDALAAARLFRASGLRALLVDTSRRPRAAAVALAEALAARYVPLPRADAGSISDTVRRGIAA